MNFIKLHNYENNTPIGIAVDSISVIFTTSTSKGNGPEMRMLSNVYFTVDTNIKNFYVNETPEKIAQMFDLPGFIKLHLADDNSTLLINAKSICIVDTEVYEGRERDKSRLYCYTSSNVKAFVVNESTEKIIELCNKIDQRFSQDQPKGQ